MSYRHEVLRWPFSYSSATLTVNKVGGGSATTSIPTQTYICDGGGAVVAPVDFVKAFETAINAALTALGGTAQIEARMGLDGRIQTQNTLADGRYTVDFNAALESILGATSADYYFGKLIVAGTNTTSVRTMTYQARNQWLPGIDADYDSGNLQRIILTEGRNLRGEPRRVRRDAGGWSERMLDWSRIASARMSTARAATASFAQVAGLTTGEVNTWENMWLYLAGQVGPYGDNRVYLYTSNDPAVAVRQGPYDVILDDSRPGTGGLDVGGYERGMASEHYPCQVRLRSIP
jgi:hypothetical protein